MSFAAGEPRKPQLTIYGNGLGGPSDSCIRGIIEVSLHFSQRKIDAANYDSQSCIYSCIYAYPCNGCPEGLRRAREHEVRLAAEGGSPGETRRAGEHEVRLAAEDGRSEGAYPAPAAADPTPLSVAPHQATSAEPGHAKEAESLRQPLRRFLYRQRTRRRLRDSAARSYAQEPCCDEPRRSG